MKYFTILTAFFMFNFSFCAKSYSAEFFLEFNQIATIVKERNQHAQSAVLLQKSVEVEQGYLKRSFYPEIEVNIGHEYFVSPLEGEESSNYAEVMAKINLYNGGRDTLQNEIIEETVSASAAITIKKANYEIRKARIAYWDMLFYQEVKAVIKEALAKNKVFTIAAQKRIDAGMATSTDLIEFEMFERELEEDMTSATISMKNAERDLAVLLGLKADTEIKTSGGLLQGANEKSVAEGYDVRKNPEVKVLASQKRVADLEVQKSSLWWMPTFNLYGRHGRYPFSDVEEQKSINREETILGVQLTFKIFDKHLGHTEKRKKIIEAAALEKQKTQTERELHSRITRMNSELDLTHELIGKAEQSSMRASDYLERVLDEYERGVKGSLDVLSATERFVSRQKRELKLRHDYLVARAELLYSTGHDA